MRISDWSSDVCSSDLHVPDQLAGQLQHQSLRLRLRESAAHRIPARGDERHRQQILKRKEPGAQAVVDIVIVIGDIRSEEHTSELQSLMRISYAVFCLKNKNK